MATKKVSISTLMRNARKETDPEKAKAMREQAAKMRRAERKAKKAAKLAKAKKPKVRKVRKPKKAKPVKRKAKVAVATTAGSSAKIDARIEAQESFNAAMDKAVMAGGEMTDYAITARALMLDARKKGRSQKETEQIIADRLSAMCARSHHDGVFKGSSERHVYERDQMICGFLDEYQAIRRDLPTTATLHVSGPYLAAITEALREAGYSSSGRRVPPETKKS